MNRVGFWNFLLALSFVGQESFAQVRYENIPFGDMNRWMTRRVEESFLIGGADKEIYELAPEQKLEVNTPFVPNLKVSPWATSSVYAKVSGVVKASTTVFPEKKGEGFAARLETRLETCKVLGVVNITVLASGTLFLGEVVEPVRDTKDPQAKLMMGIPFDKRPKEVVFDYKFKQGESHGKRIKITGFSRPEELKGKNSAEVCLLLHKRWEDQNGNVYAKRIGTAWERYDVSSSDWIDNNQVEILYGDISKHPRYRSYMGLIKAEERQYCRNSKGEITPIIEVGWGNPDEQPTHIVLRFSSSHGGAYIGAPGAILWVDNVKLGYKE